MQRALESIRNARKFHEDAARSLRKARPTPIRDRILAEHETIAEALHETLIDMGDETQPSPPVDTDWVNDATRYWLTDWTRARA